MPRPMLKPLEQKTHTNNSNKLSLNQNEKKAHQIDKLKMDRMLRKTRSKEYMNAIQKLDAGGHVHNQDKVNDILASISNEFPEIEIGDFMLGIVAKCYLGKPYEVHTLDISGQIIEHYKAGNSLIGGLEKARALAIRGGYAFIEVYIDCCRCISYDGTVSVITM